MTKGYFITGTNTGVGKTFVTAAVLASLRAQGTDAVPMKPVQTGAWKTPNGLRAPDLEFALNMAEIEADAERPLMNPYAYEPACSPHLAGRLADDYPRLDHIVACARELEAKHDCVLVEGAGGIMVPLDETTLMLDLMVELAYPVILVASPTLGTLNHTLLSLKALRDAGLTVHSVVLNPTSPLTEPDRFIWEDNKATLERLGQVSVVGPLPCHAGLDFEGRSQWEHAKGLVAETAAILRESL